MNVELDDKQLEELIDKAFNDGYMQGFKNGIRYVKNIIEELDEVEE